MIRELTELGNPILRARAIDVALDDETLPQLILDLKDTLAASQGVGIAAPQIGVSKRVFLVSSRPNSRYPNAPTMEPVAMINPRIISQSTEAEKDWEGCLSIPGIRGFVSRSVQIRIAYWDLDSREERISDYSHFIARICQHENDHLDGIVFLDRIESADVVTNKEYFKLIAQQQGGNS